VVGNRIKIITPARSSTCRSTPIRVRTYRTASATISEMKNAGLCARAFVTVPPGRRTVHPFLLLDVHNARSG